MKAHLDTVCAAVAGVTLEQWRAVSRSRATKDQLWPLIGMTPRELQIKVSEEWIKPTFDRSYFGHKAVTALFASSYTHVVFSDGGFVEEVSALRSVGRVLLVRLHRDGFAFTGDSRSYLHDCVDRELDLQLIPGDISAAEQAILRFVDEATRHG